MTAKSQFEDSKKKSVHQRILAKEKKFEGLQVHWDTITCETAQFTGNVNDI
jgi:hypothetical protein